MTKLINVNNIVISIYEVVLTNCAHIGPQYILKVTHTL